MPKPRALVLTFSLFTVTALVVSGCGSNSSSGTATGPGSSGDTSASSGAVIQKLHDLLPQSVQDSGVLKIATDPEYPPCDFKDDSGAISGFNHDLLMAMAPKLGVKIEQPAISFDGLLPGVQSGRFDGAMECISDLAEREKTVKFVDYAYATLSNMTTADNPKNITENPLSLCGLHAGVQTGTSFADNVKLFNENCAKSGKSAITVTNFPSAGTQNTAIQSKQVDFAVTSTATGVWQNKQSDNAFKVIPNPMLARQYVGITVGHDAEGTANALLGALQAIIDDGTYQDIMSGKWQLSDLVLTKPGFNLATTRPIPDPKPCGSCGVS